MSPSSTLPVSRRGAPLLAALVLAHLEHGPAVQQARQRVWEQYAAGLADWAAAEGVGLPFVPADCAQSYHMFYVVMPSLQSRTSLIAHLRARGIMAVFHYLPLHLSTMGRRYGGREGQCPVTESVSDRLVRLPFFSGLTAAEQAQVIAGVRAFACSREPVDG